jgi:uncharacterized membrane protein YfcA
MQIGLSQFLIICPLVFIAGFVDSVAGGGGIISIPSYLFAGVPIHLAYGTNKFAMCMGTSISAYKYNKSGNVRLVPALFSAGGALIGSWLGARLVMRLSEQYLSYSLMALLPLVALFLLFNRGFGKETAPKDLAAPALYSLSALIGLVMGVYDGFFGPGTGTFLALLFTAVLGFSLLNASGNAKVVNLASNIGALVVYITGGQVIYALALPAAICAISGNYLGSRLAIKNGAKFIRPLIIAVIVLLFVKIFIDIFNMPLKA